MKISVDEIEEMAALYFEQGLFKLRLERFYVKQKWWITYEEILDNKSKLYSLFFLPHVPQKNN